VEHIAVFLVLVVHFVSIKNAPKSAYFYNIAKRFNAFCAVIILKVKCELFLYDAVFFACASQTGSKPSHLDQPTSRGTQGRSRINLDEFKLVEILSSSAKMTERLDLPII